MSSCILNWYSDRGFEVDLDVEVEVVALRMAGIPIPVDGTRELREKPIELDRLDVLFKAQADVDGEPGQVREATVQLLEQQLEVVARVEDVETGELLTVRAKVGFDMPTGVPESGGPRPMAQMEDELDWEDETTLEKLVVSAPPALPKREDEQPEEAPADDSKGLQRLLAALADLDEDDMPTEAAAEPELQTTLEAPDPDNEPTLLNRPPALGPQGDQTMSAEAEARGLVQLLVDRGDLELEHPSGVASLAAGVVPILALHASSEAKATTLSGWLLDQDVVADLYIGDEDLAAILEEW